MHIITLLLSVTLASGAVLPSADSQRGEEVFQKQECVRCHSVQGNGGRTAPDLGRIVDRNFTPALLASTMWNHAPTMWSAMRQQARCAAVVRTGCRRSLRLFLLGPVL